MKKDSQFTFRIPSDLKARLEEIALSEGRSVAQICVALLQEGSEIYKKKGSAALRRLLSQQKHVS
jgi:predicted transcriptional regulator